MFLCSPLDYALTKVFSLPVFEDGVLDSAALLLLVASLL
jgi:hypothetical protein